MTSAVATRPTCEATIGKRPGAFGFELVTCSQVVGLVSIHGPAGDVHHACRLVGHRDSVVRRFGEADAAEPTWDLPTETVVFPDAADYLEGADPLTAAKAWMDRGNWTLTR